MKWLNSSVLSNMETHCCMNHFSNCSANYASNYTVIQAFASECYFLNLQANRGKKNTHIATLFTVEKKNNGY